MKQKCKKERSDIMTDLEEIVNLIKEIDEDQDRETDFKDSGFFGRKHR